MRIICIYADFSVPLQRFFEMYYVYEKANLHCGYYRRFCILQSE